MRRKVLIVLWGLTLLTLWWIAAIVSALIGGKSLDKLRETKETS